MALTRRVLFHEYPLTTWLGITELETAYVRHVAPLLDIIDSELFHRVIRAIPSAHSTYVVPQQDGLPNLHDVICQLVPQESERRGVRVAVFNAVPQMNEYQPSVAPKNLVVIVNKVEPQLQKALPAQAVETRPPGWYPSSNPSVSTVVVVQRGMTVKLVSDLLTDIYMANSAPLATHVAHYVGVMGVRAFYSHKVKFVLGQYGPNSDYGHLSADAQYVSFAAVSEAQKQRLSKARRLLEMWESFVFKYLPNVVASSKNRADDGLPIRDMRKRKRSSNSRSLGSRGRIAIPLQAPGGALSSEDLQRLLKGKPAGTYFLLRLSREEVVRDLRPIFGGQRAGRIAVVTEKKLFSPDNDYLRQYIREGRVECSKFYVAAGY